MHPCHGVLPVRLPFLITDHDGALSRIYPKCMSCGETVHWEGEAKGGGGRCHRQMKMKASLRKPLHHVGCLHPVGVADPPTARPSGEVLTGEIHLDGESSSFSGSSHLAALALGA